MHLWQELLALYHEESVLAFSYDRLVVGFRGNSREERPLLQGDG